MKKIFTLAALLLLPSVAFADRLGSIKSSSDVPLSTNTILNTSTLENKTAHISSMTVRNNFFLTDSDSAQRLKLFHSDLPRSSGFGPQIVNTFLVADTFESSSVSGGLFLAASTETLTDLNGLKGYSYLSLIPPSAAADGSVFLSTKRTGLESPASSFVVRPSSLTFVVNNVEVAEWDSNGFTSASNVIAEGTISSPGGNYAYQGTTITYDAPPLDAIERIPVLVSGEVSWDEAIRDGLRAGGYAGSTMTVTAAMIFTSSVSLNSRTDCSSFITDGHACWDSDDNKLYVGNGSSAQEIASGGGSADNMGSAIADRTIDANGFAVVRQSSATWKVGSNEWGIKPTTWAVVTEVLPTYSSNSGTNIPGLSFDLPANTSFYCDAWMFWEAASTGGNKFSVDLPSGANMLILLNGDGSSVTAVRRGEFIDTDATAHTNNFGTFAGFHSIEMKGTIWSGSSGGRVTFRSQAGTNGQNYDIVAGTKARLEQVP